MSAPPTSRLVYIDFMRGLACLLMFQTHCYDAWLGGPARDGQFLKFSQLLGTFPAPMFLFLAGVSVALVVENLRRKGAPPGQVFRKTFVRGAEVFGLGLLFRLQEYAISLGWAPTADLFRVDILNTIGISMMLMAALCFVALLARMKKSAISISAAAMAVAIAFLTPPLWTSWRPGWLPWQIESYINGVHNLGVSQHWLFPIFPWTAFAFAGLAVGFVIQSHLVREHVEFFFAVMAAAGIALVFASLWLDRISSSIYGSDDFWHSSPFFFLVRAGILLVIFAACHAWGGRQNLTALPSPLVQLGKTSLLVYWVHIEFVYGRFSILAPRSSGIDTATLGLAIIFATMLAISLARTARARIAGAPRVAGPVEA